MRTLTGYLLPGTTSHWDEVIDSGQDKATLMAFEC